MTLPSFVVNVGNCLSSKLESFVFFSDHRNFLRREKKKLYGGKIQAKLFYFSHKVSNSCYSNCRYFRNFIAIQFFFRKGNKFCMVVLCDTTTWTCGNIKAKLLWLSKKGKICSSLILTIRIFFLAVKKIVWW